MSNKFSSIYLIALSIFALVLVFFPISAKGQTEPVTIVVGTQPDFPPFCFQDENGRATGYDLELLRQIFAALPEYKIEFLLSSWDGIFIGLESNKTQMLADNLAFNDTRAAKYYLSKPYYKSMDYLVTKKGRFDIQSLEDLEGKTLALVVGSTQSLIIEKWNEEHGNIINIQYTKATNYSDPLQDVANGRVDAYVENLVNFNAVVKEQNLELQVVGDPVISSPIVIVFRKDEQGLELKTKIDREIDRLRSAGILKPLALEWTGSTMGVPE
jgi:L-cystine transport system substrate-binding protein